MSQPADNEKVTKNNERLFSIYENHLKSSNVKDYTETAAKLTVWLGDSKAYYAAARPMIVRLLIIAQMTLRSAVGYPLDISVPFMPAQWLQHPLTASYVVLVQAVRPFGDLFVETPLKYAITHLLQAVEGIPLSPVSPPSTSQQASPPFPAPTSRTDNHPKETPTGEQKSRPVSPQDSRFAQARNSSPGTAQTPPVNDELSVGSRHSTTTAEQVLPSSGSTTSDLPNAARPQRDPSPEITLTGMSHKPAANPRAVPSTPPLQGPQGSIGAPRQGLRTKRAKKIDLSAFVQSDIQDFKQRQARTQQRGASDSASIKNESEMEENPLKAVRKLVDAERIKSITPQPASPSVPLLRHSPTQNQEHLQPVSQVQPVPQLNPGPVSQPASHSRHNLASPTVGQQKHNSAHTSPISDFQPMSSLPFYNGSQTTGKTQAASMGTSIPLIPLPPSITDSQLATQPACTIVGRLSESPTTVTPVRDPPGGFPTASTASVEAQTSPRTQSMRPLLISEDSNLALFFKLYEKFTSAKLPLNVEGNVGVGESETRQRTYSDDMAALLVAEEIPKRQFQVIAFTRGGTQDSFTEIAFSLTQADMDYLSKWLNKEASQLKDTASSYCLSLGCYSSHELMKRLGTQLDATIEVRLTEAIASMPPVWPQIGGLSMNVNSDDSRKGLPLAPPLVTTADGYIDLSEFALLGRNSITIHQEEKDFSDYTFVLHAHNPTLGQLQEIVRQRKSEMEWKDWLVGVTQPLHVDVPPLSPVPF